MRHPQPGDIAHATASPEAQGEDGRPALVSFLRDQGAQDRTLLRRERSRGGQGHGWKVDAARRVALQQPLLLDEKAGEVADGRFDARAVVEAQALLLQVCQVSLHG